jgi:hypothetical protein
LGFQQLFGTTGPGTLAENGFHVVGKDDLTFYQQLGEFCMTLFVLGQYLLGTLILLVDHLQHFVVHRLGCGL